MPTAGIVRRIFADFLDSLFISSFLLLITLLTGGIPEYVVRWLEVLVAFIYFPFLESSRWQRSLGQWCLNMHVCSTLHEQLSISRAFYRQVMKLLLTLPLAIFITCVIFLFFFLGKTYLSADAAFILGIVTGIISGVVGGLLIFYVRLFNNRQQTMRDYFTRTMMLVKIKQEEV